MSRLSLASRRRSHIRQACLLQSQGKSTFNNATVTGQDSIKRKPVATDMNEWASNKAH